MSRVIGVLVLLAVLYAALLASNPAAGQPGNLIDVANIQGRYGLITVGAALVIIVGGIDLSIGSVVGCAAVLFAVLMEGGCHPYAAFGLTILFGAAVGLANGLLITQLQLQSFLVTLCGMFIYRGLARMLGGTVSRTRVIEEHAAFEEPLRQMRFYLIGKDATGELLYPAQFIVLLIVVSVIGYFLHNTVYGRYWYAIGHNDLAARYAGIPVHRHRASVYVIASALAALTGCLMILDLPSVQSDSGGLGFELYAILGAVLGGCSLRGGEGTAVGVLLGAMVLPVLENLVSFRGLKSDVIPAVIGLTLLVGTIVDEWVRRRTQR